MSPVEEEAALTTKQQSTKRKAPTSPRMSPNGAHKDKRKVSATQPTADLDMGRMYDPPGRQAYVPPMAAKEAVPSWLQGQISTGRSMILFFSLICYGSLDGGLDRY
jgi:hypothetical protein